MRKMLTACTILMGCALSQTAFADTDGPVVNWMGVPKPILQQYLMNWKNQDTGSVGTWQRHIRNPLHLSKDLPRTLKFEYVGESTANKPYCSLTHTFTDLGDYYLDVTGETTENCTITITKK